MGKLETYQDVAISPAIGFMVAETKEACNVGAPSETFTKYPNSIFDTLSSEGLPLTAYLSPAEEKVLNRCIREANGYHRTKFRMSLSEMAKMTGLSKNGVVNCAHSLAKTRLISYDASNGVGLWTLNLDQLEYALNYYASQVRTTELYSKKVKVRTTELANCTTELYSEPKIVQLSCTPSIKEKDSKEIKEITTTATAFLESEKPSSTLDQLTIAYCNALQLECRDELIFKQIEKIVTKLVGLYPDLTANRITANIIHAIQVLKLKEGQISKNWLKLSNDTALGENVEIRAILSELKGIYGLGEITPDRQWQFIQVASQIKQLYKLSPEQVASFRQCWEKKYQGMNLPSIENLLKHISIIKEKNDASIKGSNITGNGVGKVSQETWDELASRTI